MPPRRWGRKPPRGACAITRITSAVGPCKLARAARPRRVCAQAAAFWPRGIPTSEVLVLPWWFGLLSSRGGHHEVNHLAAGNMICEGSIEDRPGTAKEGSVPSSKSMGGIIICPPGIRLVAGRVPASSHSLPSDSLLDNHKKEQKVEIDYRPSRVCGPKQRKSWYARSAAPKDGLQLPETEQTNRSASAYHHACSDVAISYPQTFLEN